LISKEIVLEAICVDDKFTLKIKYLPRPEFIKIIAAIRTIPSKYRKYTDYNKQWIVHNRPETLKIIRKLGFDITFKPGCKETNSDKLISNKPITVQLYNNHLTVESKDTDFLNRLLIVYQTYDYSMCYLSGSYDASKRQIVEFASLEKNKTNPYVKMGIGFKKGLVARLKLDNNKVKTNDKRNKTKYKFTNSEIKDCLGYLSLYDYQIKAVKVCLKKVNVVIKLPTSGGKSEIFLALCKLMNRKVLLLFKAVSVLRQTYKRAQDAGLNVGIITGAVVDEKGRKIIMCSINSVHKLKEKYDTVIVDECHTAVSYTFRSFLQSNDFIYRFGFSATPFVEKERVKKLKVQEYIGDIEYTLPAVNLIAQEKIAKPRIFMVPITKPDNLYEKRWRNAEQMGIIDNDIRNQKIKEITLKSNKTMILVKRIEHGQKLASIIPNSVFISGSDAVSIREYNVELFNDTDDFVLIASGIFDQGISINCIRTLIIAGGGKSYIQTIQRLGRALRIDTGKTSVNVYDFFDSHNCILEKHTLMRIDDYKKEGFTDIVNL